jgi:SNF2 family DNA or RNA helicase
MIPGSKQVSGKDSDESKEEKFADFSSGQLRVLITKPKIGGFGLNWQHCHRMTFFPSHSFEQYYQAVRRCWRFGQKSPVIVDIITTEGELGVLENLRRKAEAADKMFTILVEEMNNELAIRRSNPFTKKAKAPSWL